MSPDNANDQLRHGQVLADRYRVDHVIGRGGMAEVYEGHDDRLARPVALKVLRAKYGSDPDLRRRFEEEAKAAAMVSHPNIVAVYDAGEDDSKAYIVMELVGGETLHEMITRGPISAALARSIGSQVLDALGAAHAKGVLHRDIKPANVLITPDGQAKVTDFGIAKAIHPSPDADQTTMNMVLGTPSYLAPERAQGHPATVASDLWAVGVMLYEAVTGVKPFEGDNPIAITLAAQQARYVPVLERRPDLDPALAAVIERAMDPEPRTRYASAAEMASALRGQQAEATRVLGAAGIGAAAAGAAALAGTEATSILDTDRHPASAGVGGTTAALGAAAVAGAAGVAGVAGAAGAAGAATTRLGATGTQMVSREDDAWAATNAPRSHKGLAVVIGAALAALLAGVIALILTAGGAPGPAPTTTTNPRLVGSTPTTSRQTTTTTTPTTTTPTTTTPTTTTPTTTAPTTTAPTTTAPTTTLPSTTAAPTTTLPPTTTAPATTKPPQGPPGSGTTGAATTTTPPGPKGKGKGRGK